MKYVKIIAILSVTLISIAMIGTQASAHPPGFMQLKHDNNNLRIIILHFSISPFSSHYVYRIEIEVNGEVVFEENYEQQPRFFINIYNFDIIAQSGDVITVNSYCSLFGQKSKTLTV